ncbi:MAG: HDOD domain-containing protein [Planctomycetota bacterium]|nr:HDOD domain-containing protein [Planctomycetota bacterium]
MASPSFERLKASGRLPSPTGVALEILRLSESEDASIEAIATLVSSDPAIVSRLLKLINSPIAGIARPIASIRQSIALLGIKTVKQLALGFSLIGNHRRDSCKRFDYDQFWSVSLGRAVAARQIVRRLGSFCPDETFTCGLLSKIGRLALATFKPESFAQVLNAVDPDDTVGMLAREREVFGIDHNELSAEMMAEWFLPELFRTAVLAQDDPDHSDLQPGSRPLQLAQTLQLGGLVSKALTQAGLSGSAISGINRALKRVGIAQPDFEADFETITDDWRAAGQIYSIATREVPALKQIYATAAEHRNQLTDELANYPFAHLHSG